MALAIEGISGRIWDEFYHEFSYFNHELVRDGCHPLIFEHDHPNDRAIVLVHGLSDSPYFMSAIGEYFYTQLGYNVYLPLLHCHGLKDPRGMEDVKLEEWVKNVRFAISVAQQTANKISTGGLSMGGALSFYMAATNPDINGELYLFSAALDLAGGRNGTLGEVKERLLRTFWPNLLEPILQGEKALIGRNPYRYTYVDLDGAQELARLIKETDTLLKGFKTNAPFWKKVFAAHSESDNTADISGIRELQSLTDPDLFHPYILKKELEVAHASVVLNTPIRDKDNAILEQANPKFGEMIEAIKLFQSTD